MRHRSSTIAALVLAGAVVLGGACTSTTTTTETGNRPGTSTATTLVRGTTSTTEPLACTPGSGANGPCSQDGGRGPDTSTPPTTCVAVPASTGVGTKGGGELICSDPGGVHAPPPTDTTIPGAPAPDGTRGALRGHLLQQVECVAAPCPPLPTSGRASLSATADGAATTLAVADDGSFGARLVPGSYTLRATTANGVDCPPQTVTVVAGQTVDVTVECPIG